MWARSLKGTLGGNSDTIKYYIEVYILKQNHQWSRSKHVCLSVCAFVYMSVCPFICLFQRKLVCQFKS